MSLPVFRTARRALTGIVLAGLVAGCSSPTETRSSPPRPAPQATPRDALDIATERDGRTVLEALWGLEKAVRERDARIADLEAEVRRLKRELADTPAR